MQKGKIVDKALPIVSTAIGVFLILFIWELVMDNSRCCMCGDPANSCCPCPNNEWFDTVEEWAGYEASSAGSWLYMCEEYQKANNVTFECFKTVSGIM